MQAEIRHQALDRAAVDVPSASGVCSTVEDDVHLPGPEHVEVRVMHLGDLLLQYLIALFPHGAWAVLARWSGGQAGAHGAAFLGFTIH